MNRMKPFEGMKLTNNVRKTAELTLLQAVPIVTGATDNSKLSGLQRKLQKIARKELMKSFLLTEKEHELVIAIIDEWGRETDWLQSAQHVGTLVVFCTSIITNSKFKHNPKLLNILVDITDHLQKARKFYKPSLTNGERAHGCWNKLVYYREEIPVTMEA